jgi:hypothetical protein
MVLKELYVSWESAGLIVTAIFALIALATGFGAFITELLIDAAFGMIPFPFDLLVTWTMNPVPVILQGILTAILAYFSLRNAGD